MAQMGEGIYGEFDSSVTIINCTIVDNDVLSISGLVTNSIIWNSYLLGFPEALTVSYSNVRGVMGEVHEGEGNIAADPLFVGNGDYRLQAYSPCIDTGTSVGAPDIDIEGIPRPQGCGYDMGAYDRTLNLDLKSFAMSYGRTDCAGGCDGDLDGDGSVDGRDLAEFAANYGRVCCSDNVECDEGYYCKKPVGQCDAAGICEPFPTVCPNLWEPVCGCDGETYANCCVAAVSGVSVSYEEECVSGNAKN